MSRGFLSMPKADQNFDIVACARVRARRLRNMSKHKCLASRTCACYWRHGLQATEPNICKRSASVAFGLATATVFAFGTGVIGEEPHAFGVATATGVVTATGVALGPGLTVIRLSYFTRAAGLSSGFTSASLRRFVPSSTFWRTCRSQ